MSKEQIELSREDLENLLTRAQARVFELQEEVDSMEQKVKDSAWDYEIQLNRMFKKELDARVRIQLLEKNELAKAWKKAAELFAHCIGIPEQYADDAGYEINKALKHAYELEGDE